MRYSYYIKDFSFRHAVSTGFAVLIAYVVEHYISFSSEYWMVLAALIVNQTTRGTPIRQGMLFLIAIIAAIFLAAILKMQVTVFPWVYFILAITFMMSGYLTFINRTLPNKTCFIAIVFSVVLLIATLDSSSLKVAVNTQNRMIDVVIGAFIGFLFTILVFPVRFAKEFSEGVIPILHSMNDYISALNEFLLSDLNSYQEILDKKIVIENILQNKQGIYPEWVYEVGFNPGLRSGLRFFLVNLERIIEALFSIDFLLSRNIEVLLLNKLSQPLVKTMIKNQELIIILLEYFKSNKIKGSISDFTSDIAELEHSLHRLIPSSLELLDISPQHLLITALVRDVRDMRGLLLQLVKALSPT